MNHLVVSFVGPDRPGLVDTISNLVNQYKGNWQTSSLHHLSGFFAGVIEIAVSEENCQTLTDQLNSIPELKCVIEIGESATQSTGRGVVLELTANDRAGIVQEVASVIHQQGGNLLKLVSIREGAAHSGVELFKAKANIDVAPEKIDDLVEALENTANDFMVDISTD